MLGVEGPEISPTTLGQAEIKARIASENLPENKREALARLVGG